MYKAIHLVGYLELRRQSTAISPYNLGVMFMITQCSGPNLTPFHQEEREGEASKYFFGDISLNAEMQYITQQMPFSITVKSN